MIPLMDYYWDVVSGDIIRGNGGLVAIHSRFGWLVSGPLKGVSANVNKCTDTCRKVQLLNVRNMK